MTKSVKILFGLMIVVIAGAGWAVIRAERERDEMREYIDSLYNQSKQSITFDSIRSIVDRRLSDSIRLIRNEIHIERNARRRETQTIRRETDKLRHLLDSIGPINRPDL